jgi:diguanylate cyclase (GGDEF)-like protein/PAS domain S-box-containing protein
VIGIVGVSRDITELRLAEAAVEKSETLFRALFDLSPDAVLVIDPHDPKVSWPVIDCNLATCQMNGYKRDELVGQSIDILNLSTGTPAERIAYMQQLRNVGNIKLETHHRRKNGVVFPVEVSTTLIEIGDRELIIGIDRDITDRKHAEEALRYKNEVLAGLHQITLGLLKHRNVDELLDSLVESSVSFFGTSFVEIMLAEDDALVVKAATKNQSGLIGRRMGRNEAMLSWQAFETREPVVLEDYVSWQQHQAVYDEFSLHAVAGFPIMNDDKCLGVLGLGRDKPGNEFTPDQVQFGRLFANLTGLVLVNVQLREALHEQSVHDPVTGLHNRRYMEEAFRQHISRVTRNLHTLGIIMIDIDHFKSFNDTHGHPAGDALLCEVGKFLQGHLRAEDIVCRYGGEEFVLIMPDALLESVHQRAQQLRSEIKDLEVQYEGKSLGAISFSLGVAIYPEHGSTQDTVLRAADDALYRAKQGGRDQVVVAERDK